MADEDTYRRRAVEAARRALGALDALGVRAQVIGSLVRGNFGPDSDIDFLVTDCPRPLKYAIEGVVEDSVQGFRFDVVYLEELPAWKRERFMEAALDAGDLR